VIAFYTDQTILEGELSLTGNLSKKCRACSGRRFQNNGEVFQTDRRTIKFKPRWIIAGRLPDKFWLTTGIWPHGDRESWPVDLHTG
jgi:hypothetical protein